MEIVHHPVQRWGEVRLTNDVDATLLTGFGGEENFVSALLRQYSPRHPSAAEFAIQSRVLLLQTPHGTPLDIALGALPFEERTMDRATGFLFANNCNLLTCSAEDLIIHKAFAGRPRDWLDIEGILIRQQGKLDLPLIRAELVPLLELKSATENMAQLEERIRRFS